MRVLVIGATGLLGRALLQEWTKDEVLGLGSRDADISERSAVREHLASFRPEWTVLTAAYTDVDGCEKNRQRARLVNTIGAEGVALECKEFGSRLLFLSTDYVFDGCKPVPYETEDAMNPLNVYGQSKADAETLVREVLPNTCIVRTSWIFGVHGRCFPNIILDAAQAGKKLSVVDDQIGRPAYNRHLAQTIARLCRAGAQGIVHASNSGSCSWHEFACHLLRVAGFPDIHVAAVPTEAFPRLAKRPKYSVLSLKSLERHAVTMPTWQDAVADYITERNASDVTPISVERRTESTA
jgi:dTDP-4-dehydrorhamnose reductase